MAFMSWKEVYVSCRGQKEHVVTRSAVGTSVRLLLGWVVQQEEKKPSCDLGAISAVSELFPSTHRRNWLLELRYRVAATVCQGYS